MLHIKKLSWLLALPVIFLVSSCSKSAVLEPPADEAYWLQQPRGAVVETGGFSCGYFIVQNQLGYSLMRSNSTTPFIGSVIYGQHKSWGYSTFYNRSGGYLFNANVVDYGLTYFDALNQLDWYCRDPFDQ